MQSPLSDHECKLLCRRLDEAHDNNDTETDLKLTWSRVELETELGIERVAALVRLFADDVDEFKLRRVAANGECINFHMDYSYKTMQVCLNGDDEYEGGNLVFVTDSGTLLKMKRPRGFTSIHTNEIVHGVTQHKGGIRYALFLLKTKL